MGKIRSLAPLSVECPLRPCVVKRNANARHASAQGIDYKEASTRRFLDFPAKQPQTAAREFRSDVLPMSHTNIYQSLCTGTITPIPASRPMAAEESRQLSKRRPISLEWSGCRLQVQSARGSSERAKD